MKKIKAVVPQSRVSGVLDVLRNISSVDARAELCWQSLLVYRALRPVEADLFVQQHYSTELAEPVVGYHLVEMLCEDDIVDIVVAAIRQAARTGQRNAGWITVNEAQLLEWIS